jgi:predicted nucleotidyltransferase
MCYTQEMVRSPAEIDPALLRAFRAAICAKIEREIAREQQTAERLRSEVLPRLRRGVERARDEGLCQGAWLIGSYAWGTPTERSDVDIVLEKAGDLTRIASLVGEEVRCQVHVIPLGAASEELRQRAISSGVPL